ncbi:hypothetical protein SSX86_028649 [Deinandra increscens subsp. villosa]|uniref:Uncharacterized protein n=1 Tax=Deinandra increscens subsp. villosa TaxID=3103831 RepID=A0AAP0GJU4_9ASTR
MVSARIAYANCKAIKALLDNNYYLMQDEICDFIHEFQENKEKRYGEPMLWIGIYIAVASLLCVLAMAADLFHGFRNKKLWFPSKYFTLNVASIMVITTAMKLPVDLNDPMPGWADQFAKLASLPFMSIMMVNLMPSLASMDNKELSENVVGLFILVITIVVNVLIQIHTGVLDRLIVITYIFIGEMLYILFILTSLALTTPVSKHILEIKYQAARKMVSKDIHSQHARMSTLEELTRYIVFFANLEVSNCDIIHESALNDVDEDIQRYVMQLDNEIELGTRTLQSISKSLDHLIEKAEKQVPKKLLELVERSNGFGGVLSFDSDEVQPLVSVELPNNWSLLIVTLTSVAITLPNVCKEVVDSLFNSVSEGLVYTFLVDESFNNTGEAITILKATRILWHEVELNRKVHKHKWLGNTLQRNDFTKKTPTEILKWFSDKGEEIIVEINKNNSEELLGRSKDMLIAANSMYRVTQTIMLKFHHEYISEEQLFALLSEMITSIMVACLTNLPRVIVMKCYESTIEQREASVQAAATILGNTKKIIERLQVYDLPSLEPNQLALIDEWHVYLKQSVP